MGSMFKGQAASLDFMTTEDGKNTLSRNVGKRLPLVEWKSFTDVSEQRMGSMFKGQAASLDFLTTEDRKNTLSRNDGKRLPLDAA
jgi:hypothetical protein